jgi:hypothetical protein
MRTLKIVVWEILLLLASVLVFRSVWTLLDRIPALTSDFGLWASLILGAIVTFMAIFMINKCAEKAEKQKP